MPEERFLIVQLHELLTYLGQPGVATILVGAHQGLIGGQMSTPVDASYLADAVVLLRYFEAEGEVRQAISVVKKRGGAHERTHPRVQHEERAHQRRRAAARLPRHPDRRAGQKREHVSESAGRADSSAGVLILAPTAKDACSSRRVLDEARALRRVCRDLDAARARARARRGRRPDAEEALAGRDGRLATLLARQPPWSDLPVLVLSAPGADSPTRRGRGRTLGNVTVLERPIRVPRW